MNMNFIKCSNVKSGKINEKKVLDYLNRNNDPVDYWINNNVKNEYDVIDFKHNERNLKIELKSRNYKSNDFVDWQIGMNKIMEMINDKENRYYVFFLFYDGLYKWDFHMKNLINQTTCKEGGTERRGKNERTEDSVYIKAEYLDLVTRKVVNEPLDDFEVCLL